MALAALCVQRTTYCGWSGHGTAWQGAGAMHFCGSKQPRTFYAAAAERPPKTYQLSIPVAMITGTGYGYK